MQEFPMGSKWTDGDDVVKVVGYCTDGTPKVQREDGYVYIAYPFLLKEFAG